MAQIPNGSGFGQVRVQPVKMGGIAGPSTAIADGLASLGAGISSAVEQDQALKHGRAGDAVLDRQLQVRTVASQLGQQLQDGTLAYDDAPKVYQTAVAKLQAPKFDGLGAEASRHYSDVVRRLDNAGLVTLQPEIYSARQATFRTQTDQAIDTIGKQVALGANVDGLNQQLNALDERGQVAYGQGWATVKQNARDKNWYNQASQRAVQSRDNMPALQALEQELSDPKGFYADKLDTDKRNSLLSSVMTSRTRLEAKVDVALRQREVLAERSVDFLRSAMLLGDVDQRVVTHGLDSVRGTSYEPVYRTLIPQAQTLQQQRRLPFGMRSEAINQIEQGLRGNPSIDPLADKSLIDTLRSGYEHDLKTAKDDPWQFRRIQTGQEPAPLDLQLFLTPDGANEAMPKLQARIADMRALQKQYGPEVAFTPFTPGEVSTLQAFLSVADDQSKLQILSSFTAAAKDGKEYDEIVKPLTDNQPLLGYAASASRRGLKSDSGRQLGLTILQGDRIRKDLSVKSLLPEDKRLEVAFNTYVGTAMLPGSPLRNRVFDIYKAVYAEVARSNGVLGKQTNGVVDADSSATALSMATGGIVSYNGRKVIPPYGMSESDFTNKVHKALLSMGMPANKTGNVILDPVVNKEGAYYLTQGLHRMLDANGRSLEVQVK